MARRSARTWSIGILLLAGLVACDRLKGKDDDESSDRSKDKKAQTDKDTTAPSDTSTADDPSAPVVPTSPAVGGYHVGDAVAVEWRGTWYAASVLAVQGERYRIHYTGWGSEWDEWVGPGRIRPGSGVTRGTATPSATSASNSAMCFPDCGLRNPPPGQQCCPPQFCQNDAQCSGRACCLAPGGHVAQCLSSCTAGWTRYTGPSSAATSKPTATTKPTTGTLPFKKL